MKKPLPALDLNLLIEHGGHQTSVIGSRYDFVARFPTLLSLLHFVRTLWPSRKEFPRGYGFQIEWKGFRFPLKRVR